MPDGILYIISAPSGGGKTTLTKAMLAKNTGVEVSISYTTRSPRSGEVDGIHYHFIDDKKFQEKLDRDEFLEHADVFGKHYGTCHEAVLEKLRAGINVILVIDWQGAAQVRKRLPSAISIFILPPSLPTLRERLTIRGDDLAAIDRRVAGAIEEISHYVDYDYLVINDKFDDALSDLEKIICSQSSNFLRQKQEIRHKTLLESLFH